MVPGAHPTGNPGRPPGNKANAMTVQLQPLNSAQVLDLFRIGLIAIACDPDTDGSRSHHSVFFTHNPTVVIAELPAVDYELAHLLDYADQFQIAFPGCEAAKYLVHVDDVNARNFRVREVNINGHMSLQYLDRPDDPIV